MTKDLFGKALLDYLQHGHSEDIATISSLDEKDVMPLPYLFRSYDQMPPLEQKALQLCKGSILDIGCGAGSHSLYLQEQGKDVTALDASKGAIETTLLRGVLNTAHTELYNFKEAQFDTLLLLMNGIGIAGSLGHIDVFFTHLKSLLAPNGQILIDSTDIIYMFEDEQGDYWIPDSQTYYGEVHFSMTYKGEKSDQFPWLYLDYNTLQRAAISNNLTCELVSEGEHYDYLAKLTLKSY